MSQEQSTSIVVRSGQPFDWDIIINGFKDILRREPNASYIREVTQKYPSVVVMDGERFIGFAYCGFMSPDVLELANIALHNDYRNSGIGSQMLQRLEAEASQNYKAVMLTNSTLYGNEAGKREATNFYLKNGYRLVACTDSTNLFWKDLI